MSMKRANLKTQKFCAFCKNWYDPANSHINPVTPKFSIWEFDPTVKSLCRKRNHDTRSNEKCSFYDCKIDK